MAGSELPWAWALVFEDQALRLKHAEHDFDLLIRAGSPAVWIERGEWSAPVRPEAFDPDLHKTWDFYYEEMVRAVMLRGERPPRGEVRRVGDWSVLTTPAFFAVRHRAWPYALATLGSSAGTWVSIGPDKAAFILGFDAEEGKVLDAEGPWTRF